MNLQEEFLNFSEEKRKSVQFKLCENALEILNKYFAETGEISYVESIVGTFQIVDSKLPSDAFESAISAKDLRKTYHRYAEPISAMQSDDLVFPDHIEFAFYSIYNLFQKYVLHRKIDDWLIVNQALSAELSHEKWNELLENTIEETKWIIESKENFLN